MQFQLNKHFEIKFQIFFYAIHKTVKDLLHLVFEELRFDKKVRTQKEFAEKLGYGKTYMSQLMNGLQPVNDKVLQSIAHTFGYDLDKLRNNQLVKLTEPTPPAKIPELHEVNIPYLNKEELEKIAGMKTEYATKDEVNELREMLVRLANKVDRLSQK